MIKIAHKREEGLLKNLPAEVAAKAMEIATVLDDSYGEERAVEHDLGGYVLIAEVEEDVKTIKELINLEDILPEYVDLITCSNCGNYTNSLMLLSSDYSISLLITSKHNTSRTAKTHGGIAMDANTTIEPLAEQIVTDFEEALAADGKADKTLESYVGDIRGFLKWLESKGTIFTGNLKRFHITSYRNYLVQEGYEINTINKKINSLQSFNQFLIDRKYLTGHIVDIRKDKVKVAAGSEKEVKVFTDVEIEKLLFYIQSEEVSSRDRLIILLLLYTGVRVSELVNVKLKDIDVLSMNLTVAWGKGGKRREVPLKGEVIDAVREYLEGERKNNKFADSEYVILTNRSAKMDRDAVNRLLNRMESKLDIRMHPHKFRHTFSTRLLKRGVELTTVAKLAGHASIQTTARFYINTSQKDKRNAIELL